MGRTKRAAAAAAEKAIKGADAAADKASKKSKTGLAVGDELPSFEVETDSEATLSSADLVRNGCFMVVLWMQCMLALYSTENRLGVTSPALGTHHTASRHSDALQGHDDATCESCLTWAPDAVRHVLVMAGIV